VSFDGESDAKSSRRTCRTLDERTTGVTQPDSKNTTERVGHNRCMVATFYRAGQTSSHRGQQSCRHRTAKNRSGLYETSHSLPVHADVANVENSAG